MDLIQTEIGISCSHTTGGEVAEDKNKKTDPDYPLKRSKTCYCYCPQLDQSTPTRMLLLCNLQSLFPQKSCFRSIFLQNYQNIGKMCDVVSILPNINKNQNNKNQLGRFFEI